MFKILDGRDKFYQWDKNRKLLVEDSRITEVHFCNRYGNTSIIRATYQLEGKTLVDVPNVILQDSFKLHTYAFDTEYTKHEDVFEIVARTKPEDYINTEEDVKLWDELAQKLIDLEGKVDGEGIQAAVIQYLTDNPPEAGATREEAAQIAQNKEDIAQNKEDINQLRQEFDNFEIPEVDFTGYATEKYVDDAIAEIDFPEGADLTGYAKKTYVDNAIANIKHPTPDLSGYAKTSDLTSYAKKTDIPSTTGFATKTYVDNAIENLDIPEAEVDLTDYYTKEEVDGKISGKVDKSFFLDFTNATTTPKQILEEVEMKVFCEELEKGNSVCANIREASDIAPLESNFFYPAIIQKVNDTTFNVMRASINLNGINNETKYGIYQFSKVGSSWTYERLMSDTYHIVTSENIDNFVSTTGGGSGAPEVAIGSTEPTNGEVLWIDPEQSNDYVTKAQLQSDGSLVENPDGTISTAIGGSRKVVNPAVVAFEQSGSFTNKQGNGSIQFGESYGLNLTDYLNSEKPYRLKTIFKENATGVETVTDIKMTYEKYSNRMYYWTTGAQQFFSGLRINNMSVWLMVSSSLYETHTLTYILIETIPEYEYVKLNSDFINIDTNTMNVNSIGELGNNAPITGDRAECIIQQLVKSGTSANRFYNNNNKPSHSAVFGYGNQLGGEGSFIAGNGNYHYGAGRSFLIGRDNGSSNAYGAHLIGDNNLSNDNWNYVLGKDNSANGTYNYMLGEGLITNGTSCQTVVGHYNNEDGLDYYNFTVGNGTSADDRRNAMTINTENNASFAGTVTSQGADYAEYFEWADGNPEAEDRVGYIVALKGDKIVKAQAEDEVLGIISGTVAVLGDNYEWHWSGKYLTDDFGRVIYDLVDKYSEPEEEGEEPIFLGQVKVPRINPEWDSTKEYKNRANRAEWDTVGMFGKLFVRDDGSCVVGEYAATGADGLATLATGKTNMYVMERINENIVKVLLK